MATHEVQMVEVPKPHVLSSKKDAKKLDDFMWHMERYLQAWTLMDEVIKISATILYLTNITTLWWHWWFVNIKKGIFIVDTWDEFKTEIKRQLYPKEIAYLARKSMRHLKHTARSMRRRFLDWCLRFKALTRKSYYSTSWIVCKARSRRNWANEVPWPRQNHCSSSAFGRIQEGRLL